MIRVSRFVYRLRVRIYFYLKVKTSPFGHRLVEMYVRCLWKMFLLNRKHETCDYIKYVPIYTIHDHEMIYSINIYVLC